MDYAATFAGYTTNSPRGILEAFNQFSYHNLYDIWDYLNLFMFVLPMMAGSYIIYYPDLTQKKVGFFGLCRLILYFYLVRLLAHFMYFFFYACAVINKHIIGDLNRNA